MGEIVDEEFAALRALLDYCHKRAKAQLLKAASYRVPIDDEVIKQFGKETPEQHRAWLERRANAEEENGRRWQRWAAAVESALSRLTGAKR